MNTNKLRSSSVFLLISFNFFLIVVVYSSSSDLSSVAQHQLEEGLLQRRGLKSFMEKGATGSNLTFDCSPSGPCVPCLYHEKKDKTYRCSETGYRIPMKCVKIPTAASDEENNNKKLLKGRNTLDNTNDKPEVHAEEDPTTSVSRRNLLEDSATIEVGSEIYITYRSCITPVNEEKLSVLGFEALMLLLLVSSSFAIFRRKGTLFMMPGAIRVPSNPRF